MPKKHILLTIGLLFVSVFLSTRNTKGAGTIWETPTSMERSIMTTFTWGATMEDSVRFSCA